MEQRMTHQPSSCGFVLPMVLFITAIGLLFGAGALLLFRYQCQLRIERQHELEKVYAVRSALNFIRTHEGVIDNENDPFKFHTGSDRDLKLIVKPVEYIFPDYKTNHLDLADGGKNGRVLRIPCGHNCCQNLTNYCQVLDYEYGSIGLTNLQEYISNNKVEKRGRKTTTTYGIQFNSPTNDVDVWVNIGMKGTGGWLQDEYGRRYYFYPYKWVNSTDGELLKDKVQFCLIRDVTNNTAAVGQRRGWPLSQKAYDADYHYLGERALVFQLRPRGTTGEDKKTTEATFWEYYYDGTSCKPLSSEPLLSSQSWPDNGFMGIQIANDTVTMFYISMEGEGSTSGGYTFSSSTNMSSATFRYFNEEVTIGGVAYHGTNIVDGVLRAPEMRAVFNITAISEKRNGYDFFSDLRVSPAYQYDIFLEYPLFVTNRATVVQKIGNFIRGGTEYTTFTYDTHGTEHKGFRYDEKQARENQ